MSIKILNRWTNACIWEGEVETIKDAVAKAIASRANLRDSDLSDSNLRGCNLSDSDLRGCNLRGSNLRGCNLSDSDLSDSDLRGSNLSDSDLSGSNLSDSDLSYSDLSGSNLRGSNLSGCNLCGVGKIKAIRVMTGLYRYVIFAIVAEDGEPWVRMGCQWRSVTEWDRITIRDSRTREFPNDGSTRSEQRARAFEFARGEAIEMAKEFSK